MAYGILTFAAPYQRALTGDRGEALVTLDAAHAICEPLGARPALARAAGLVARLAAQG
jgi:hypothetical protein